MDKNFTKQIRLINEIDGIIHAKMLNESFMKLSLDEQILLIEQSWNPFTKEFWSDEGGPAAAYDATVDYVSDISLDPALEYIQYGLSGISVAAYATAGVLASTGLGLLGPAEIALAVGYCSSALDGMIDLGRATHAYMNDDPVMGSVYLSCAGLSFIGCNWAKGPVKIGTVMVGKITAEVIEEGGEKAAKETFKNTYTTVATNSAEEISYNIVKKNTTNTSKEIATEIGEEVTSKTVEKTTQKTIEQNRNKIVDDLIKNNTKNQFKSELFNVKNKINLVHQTADILPATLFGADEFINPNLKIPQTFMSGFKTKDNTIGGAPQYFNDFSNFLTNMTQDENLPDAENKMKTNSLYRLLDPHNTDIESDERIIGPQNKSIMFQDTDDVEPINLHLDRDIDSSGRKGNVIPQKKNQ